MEYLEYQLNESKINQSNVSLRDNIVARKEKLLENIYSKGAILFNVKKKNI